MEKRRRVVEEGTGVDRISQLPEPILHDIQALLDLKQAARTSALSKTWNTVWSNLPFLNFDENYFRPRYLYLREDIEANNKKMIAFIDKTLDHRRRQGLRIEKFVLSAELAGYGLDFSGHLGCWIGCLIACNIKELILHLTRCGHRLLPPSLFSIPSLTSLSLKDCKLTCPAIEQVELPNLRKLCLEDVNMDDQLLRDFFSIFHRLEYFLFSSFRMQRLQISGLLPYLKILIIKNVKDVEVEASNLQELTFSRIGRPPKINPASFGNTLKCLTLACVSDEDDVWFSRVIPNLPVLETLSLEDFDLKALKVSSHSLKHLSLKQRSLITWTKAFKAQIDTPNLQNFSYEGDLPNLLLNQNLAIGHVNVRIYGSEIDGDELIKLIQFLRQFNHSKVVKLSIPYFVMSMEMREKLLPPLAKVKPFICCNCIPRATPLSDAVTHVLDGLLWLSSCQEKLSISVAGLEYNKSIHSDYDYCERFSFYDEGFTVSLKLMYEDELKNDLENKSCCHCDSIPFRCWRHSLKKVEIEKPRYSVRVDDVVQSIKNYFMANLCSRSKPDVSRLFTERWVDTVSCLFPE